MEEGCGGGPWRVMRRGLLGAARARAGGQERGGERKRKRAAATEGAWARIERERGRQRQIPCLTRLGSMRSSARTPRRPRVLPSFLPSFSLLCSSLPSPFYLTHSVVSPFLYPSLASLSLSLCPFLFLRVSLFSYHPPLSLSISLTRSFSRVSSSVLSRRAADADAGASGIATTVGAVTPPPSLPPCPRPPLNPSPFGLPPHLLSLSLSTLFEKQRRWPSAQRTRR